MTQPLSCRSIARSQVPRLNILGTGFSILNPQSTVDEIASLIDSGKTGYVTVTNADGAVRGRSDEKLRQIYNESFLTTPDGMPVVWMGKANGHKDMSRVYGPDLMLRLFIEGRRRHWKHFFYGGREGVAEELKERLEGKFPGTEIVGTWCPPFRDLSDEEEEELITRVNRTRPDIVWVGIGSPRQDQFMAKMVGRLDCGVMIGVGAAFDFHAGKVDQAPTEIQDAGLEWLYRLSREPRRLLRRYAYTVPRFVLHAGAQMIGMSHYPDPTQ